MKLITLLLLSLLYTLSAHAQISEVSSGAAIEATKINSMIVEINKMYDIGDIRSSLLSENQFQTRNGTCWVMMNGQNVSGSIYENITGRSSLPSAAGRFLRNAGGNAEPVAQLQEDDFKSHTHTQNAHNHHSGQGYIDTSGGQYGAVAGGGNQRYTNMSAGNPVARWNTSPTTAINQNTGGAETRPQNLTVNMFVKINNCN